MLRITYVYVHIIIIFFFNIRFQVPEGYNIAK